MSSPSSHHSSHPHHHHPHPGRHHARRHPAGSAAAAKAHPAPARDAYVLSHAGRQVRFGPVIFWIVVGTVSLLGIWSAATATYFTFRDDVLTRLLARQAEMQYSYEDRIAELRARIDRTTSRQLLDQEQFEQKLDEIINRQAALDSRTSALSGLPDVAVTGSIKPPARSFTEKLFGSSKPSPITDGGTPGRQSWLDSRAAKSLKLAKSGSVDDIIARLQGSLDQIEQKQMAALSTAEKHLETRVKRVQTLFADLGLKGRQFEASPPRGGVGGPYVPVKLSSQAGPFEQQLYRVNLSRAQLDRLSRGLSQIPYRTPVMGAYELSSGFGVRSDPFLGRPAMHTGLDFRASIGDPVRATASGRVVTAGWSGGYGRMVEIDHGNGLSTRYGHMSRINVKVGEQVQVGQIVGQAGSTGRSTGPHLHYETRIDGEAVDPQRFLRAGARFIAG